MIYRYEPANDNHLQTIDSRALHASIDKIERFLDDLRADLGQARKITHDCPTTN